MTTRLALYNGALVSFLGAKPLDDLTDDRAERYALDDVWDRGAERAVLQMGQWNFAARSARLEYESSITPTYGYRYAFEKPSDFVRTIAVCSDEYYRYPLREYTDEIGYWWCDLTELYVRFVSDGNTYGGDLSAWPEDFATMAQAYLALRVCKAVSAADKYDSLREEHKSLLSTARSTDAMEQPSPRQPQGSWSRARLAGGAHNDFGSKSRLIG